MEVVPEFTEEDLRRFRDWETSKGEEYLCDFMSVDSCSDDRKLKTDVKVPGRILGRHEVYSRVGASQYIVDTVRDGYKLVFDSLPLPSFTKNNKSAILNRAFMWEELLRLESLGCISRVQEQPKASNLISSSHIKTLFKMADLLLLVKEGRGKVSKTNLYPSLTVSTMY